MATPFGNSAPDRYADLHGPLWTRSEKAVARKAFDAALNQELQELIQETKRLANQIKQASDLWELEHRLTKRRKEIDRKYDRRASHLVFALGKLLHEGRVREEQLAGLSENKLKSIRSTAEILAEPEFISRF